MFWRRYHGIWNRWSGLMVCPSAEPTWSLLLAIVLCILSVRRQHSNIFYEGMIMTIRRIFQPCCNISVIPFCQWETGLAMEIAASPLTLLFLRFVKWRFNACKWMAVLSCSSPCTASFRLHSSPLFSLKRKPFYQNSKHLEAKKNEDTCILFREIF